MTVDQWQRHLQERFAALRDHRAHGQDPPVLYALEHGLTTDELSDLNSEVEGFIQESSPLDRHWLVWVVYSAEIGYEFSGDEYWTTFEERTPGWVESGVDRSWLRSVFWRFHREYSGAKPEGRWANHFSIIAWPITHAILPRDLQRQLAQSLYDIRYLFDSELLGSPEVLGTQIEAHSWNANSRFRDLAGEHLLGGQIATALLLDEKERETALILRSTLERIASDLDRNRRSQEWLEDARNQARTIRLRGLRRGDTYATDNEEDSEFTASENQNRRSVVELGIEPDLVLRPVDARTWDVRLQLPDLSPLLTRFPEFKAVLSGERCKVAGAKGRTLAREFLLHGGQNVTLTEWPEPAEVLLKFENSQLKLDFLLTSECLLRPGPRWLFKVLAGGTAVEIKSHTIQPGNSYIILTRASSGIGALALQCTLQETTCSGVSAVRLDAPASLPHEYSEQLAFIGLHPASGLRVRPVGIPAAKWNDQGSAEWLSTDSPVLAISSDFELSGLVLNLRGPSPAMLELSGNELRTPTLIDLGRLEAGRYKLHVITAKHSSPSPQIDGTLSFTVREPRTWQQEIPKSTPFSVQVSPPKPDLEELWDGRATIEVLGPRGRKAESELWFYKDAAAQSLLHTKQLAPFDLPATNEVWQEALDAARSDKRTQNAFDESSACVVAIQCDELGEFRLSCERQATPLRWILKEENHGFSLRLLQLNDQLPVAVSLYAFERPDIRCPVPSGPASFRVLQEGGLYSASTENFRSAIVVPSHHIQSFAQLQPHVQLSQRKATEQELGDLLDILELWSTARISGNPITRRTKDQIVRSLKAQLVSLLCGDLWAKLERGRSGVIAVADLRNAISSNIHHSAIGRSLVEQRAELGQGGTLEICRRLSELTNCYLDLPTFSVSRDHHVARQDWVVELAFRLANEPEQIQEWARDDLQDGLRYLLRNSVLLRIGRLASLLHASASGQDAVFQNEGQLIPCEL